MAVNKQVGIYMEGTRQLRKTLREAGDDLQDLKDAHRAAGQIVVPIAIRYAPVGKPGKSKQPGRLRNSVRAGATKTYAAVRAGGKRVPYAPPIHWGWFRRKIRPSLFIARAAKDGEPQWVPAYLEKLNKAIDKVEGK